MTQLRIATFNLKDFFDPRTDHERPIVEQKVRHVAELVRRADADVIGLQEVGSASLVERLVSKELAGAGYFPPHVGPGDRRGIGCAIVSRLPIVSSSIVAGDKLAFPRFSANDPEPFGTLPLRRPVVRLRVDAGAFGEVDVLTIHFKSRLAAALKDAAGQPVFDDTPRAIAEAHIRAWVMRSAEALHLRGVVDAILAENPVAKIAVVGDFNDSIDSLPVRTVRGGFAYVDPAKRLTSCAERVELDRRFSILHGGHKDLIDHILVSPALAAHLEGAAVLNETLRDHGPYKPDAPIEPDSDHAPVVAWFRA